MLLYIDVESSVVVFEPVSVLVQTGFSFVLFRRLLFFFGLLSHVQVDLDQLVQVIFEAGEGFLVDGERGGGEAKFPDVLFDIVLLGVDFDVRGHYFGDVFSVLF